MPQQPDEIVIERPDHLRSIFSGPEKEVLVALVEAETTSQAMRVVEETGVDARFDQSVVVHQDALDQEHIFLRRDVSSAPQDSGWLIADVSQAGEVLEEGLEAVSIAALYRQRPALLKCLSVPQSDIIT